MQRAGGRDRVCRELAQATKDLQRILGGHDLTLHTGKTRVLSNDRVASVSIFEANRCAGSQTWVQRGRGAHRGPSH
eukprot:6178358-Pyramimonas_sp.AAC.1